MQARFDVEELIDDAGVATYRAMLSGDVWEDGRRDPSALVGWGDTHWEAIGHLVEQLSGVRFEPSLFEPTR